MRFRLSIQAIAISAVAAVALLGAPLLAVELTHQASDDHAAASELDTDTSVQSATPAVARIDQRDTAPERLTKHRLVLVAILTALVAATVVLRTARRHDGRRRPPWPAASSPYSGRAPPPLVLHCA